MNGKFLLLVREQTLFKAGLAYINEVRTIKPEIRTPFKYNHKLRTRQLRFYKRK